MFVDLDKAFSEQRLKVSEVTSLLFIFIKYLNRLGYLSSVILVTKVYVISYILYKKHAWRYYGPFLVMDVPLPFDKDWPQSYCNVSDSSAC